MHWTRTHTLYFLFIAHHLSLAQAILQAADRRKTTMILPTSVAEEEVPAAKNFGKRAKRTSLVFTDEVDEQGMVLGDLDVLANLGAGTFGRVKLVQHKRSKRTYALKILLKATDRWMPAWHMTTMLIASSDSFERASMMSCLAWLSSVLHQLVVTMRSIIS